MEAIKHSMDELAQHFNTKMAEFQLNLQSAVPATSPTSNITSQFSSFRNFVLSAMEGLQLQIELLSKQLDNIETRSRRKILLFHGVPEEKKENLSVVLMNIFKENLQLPELSPSVISRCYRMGQVVTEKPRAILVKLQEQSVRNQIWFSKTRLKNSGITLSEFLTKCRHDTFMLARQKFGVSKCWTRDGVIIIIGPDGKRHHITTKSEIPSIIDVAEVQTHSEASGTVVTASGTSRMNTKIGKIVQASQIARTKRHFRK